MEHCIIRKRIEFDAGHRVPAHGSGCRNVHGHRYKLEVEALGPISTEAGATDEGMVADFGDLKKLMMAEVHARFDHRFIMYMHDRELKKIFSPGYPEVISNPRITPIGNNAFGLAYLVPGFGIVQEVPGIPTAENLAMWIFNALSTSNAVTAPPIHRVRLWETPNSLAIYPAK